MGSLDDGGSETVCSGQFAAIRRDAAPSEVFPARHVKEACAGIRIRLLELTVKALAASSRCHIESDIKIRRSRERCLREANERTLSERGFCCSAKLLQQIDSGAIGVRIQRRAEAGADDAGEFSAG